MSQFTQPRRLRTEEIPNIVNDLRLAVRNVIEAGEWWLLHGYIQTFHFLHVKFL